MQTTLTSQAPAIENLASLLHCLCACDGISTTRQHCFESPTRRDPNASGILSLRNHALGGRECMHK